MILVITMVKMITDDLPDNADDNNNNNDDDDDGDDDDVASSCCAAVCNPQAAVETADPAVYVDSDHLFIQR